MLGLSHACYAIHGSAHDNADSIGILRDIQPALRQSLFGGDNGKLHKPVGGSHQSLGKIIQRIKVFHFRCNLHRKLRRVKSTDAIHTGHAFDQILPIGGYPNANRRYCAHACDY